MKANSLFYNFILKQIMESVLFSYQNHLIKALRLVFDTKVTSTKVVPPTFAI